MSATLLDVVELACRNPNFSNQVTQKRLRRQLTHIQDKNPPNIIIKSSNISQVGLDIDIKVSPYHSSVNHPSQLVEKPMTFRMRLNFDYPFSKPKIMLLDPTSPYAEGKNLIHHILAEVSWGPAVLLETIVSNLSILPVFQSVFKRTPSWDPRYYTEGEMFMEPQLQFIGIQAFEVEELEWRMLIQSSKKRVLGLTDSCVLFMTASGEGGNRVLKLEKFIAVCTIADVKGKITGNQYRLELRETALDRNQKATVITVRGPSKDLELILMRLNPIQEMERRLNVPSTEESLQLDELIEWHMKIIEHYSLRDLQITRKYIDKMKKLVQKKQNNHK